VLCHRVEEKFENCDMKKKKLKPITTTILKVKRLVFTNFDTKFTSFDEDTFYL